MRHKHNDPAVDHDADDVPLYTPKRKVKSDLDELAVAILFGIVCMISIAAAERIGQLAGVGVVIVMGWFVVKCFQWRSELPGGPTGDGRIVCVGIVSVWVIIIAWVLWTGFTRGWSSNKAIGVSVSCEGALMFASFLVRPGKKK